MEENFQSISDKKPLNIGQKILAAILVLSAIIVFIFGIWQFKTTIQSPFKREAGSNKKTSSDESKEESSIIEMQNKDTDGDGLSDYEEFYIYKTSPYLADSDSDNIGDKKEIDAGGDPNCGDGQNCAIVNPQEQATEQKNTSNSDSKASNNSATDILNFSTPDNSLDLTPNLSGMQDSAADLFGDLSVAEIRALLKENGLPSEILDQLSDEQLLEAYKTTLENMNEIKSP